MSLRQALPAALEAKNRRGCEYGGLSPLHATRVSDETDRVQRDLMLINRLLRDEDPCVCVSFMVLITCSMHNILIGKLARYWGNLRVMNTLIGLD